MFKKITISILLLMVSAVVLSGCGTAKKEETGTQEETIVEKNETGVFDSIRDAMARSMSLKCEYMMQDNTTVAYIKGQSLRIDGTVKDKNSTAMIMKDNKIWSWDTGTKEGIIMPLTENKENQQALDPDKIIGDLESQKQFCRAASVADSMFVPPADVKFQDLSALFKNITGYPQQP